MNTKEEQRRTVEKIHKGIRVSYTELFYWDYEVNEETGTRDKNKLARFYTKKQVTSNHKELKEALKKQEGGV